MTDLAWLTGRGDVRSRLRVLAVEDGPGLWGAQRWLLRLEPLLRARDVEVVLASPSTSAISAAWPGVRVDLSDEPDRAIRGRDGRVALGPLAAEIRRSRRRAAEIAAHADAVDVDVVVANAHWTHVDVALSNRRPAVVVLHEETSGFAAASLRGLAVRRTAGAIAVSAAVARGVPRWARRNVTTVPNGIDLEAFRPGPADSALRQELAADPGAPLALVLCRLDRHKGVDDAIRAVAATPDVQLAIAGSPSLDPGWDRELRSLASSLLGDRARFLGARRDVAEILRAVDVVMLASSLEGMPLSVLEAQACGTPVVAYATAGVPEIVRDGDTGVLVPAGDVGALADGIARVTSQPEFATRLGRAGRELVEGSHDIERQADAVVAVLADAAGTHAR